MPNPARGGGGDGRVLENLCIFLGRPQGRTRNRRWKFRGEMSGGGIPGRLLRGGGKDDGSRGITVRETVIPLGHSQSPCSLCMPSPEDPLLSPRPLWLPRAVSITWGRGRVASVMSRVVLQLEGAGEVPESRLPSHSSQPPTPQMESCHPPDLRLEHFLRTLS